jgi:hypothetical protein
VSGWLGSSGLAEGGGGWRVLFYDRGRVLVVRPTLIVAIVCLGLAGRRCSLGEHSADGFGVGRRVSDTFIVYPISFFLSFFPFFLYFFLSP